MEKSPTGMCQRLLICTVCLIMLEHSTSHLISGTYQKWNVSNVGDMYRMFFNAESFNQQLDKWQVTDRTVTSDMFVGSNLKYLPEWFR